MKENNIVKSIKDSFSGAFSYMHDTFKVHLEKKKAELTTIEKRNRDQIIYNFMRDLTFSLAVIFYGKRYVGLHEIYSPYHFRIINYREIKNNRFYIFSVSKNFGDHSLTKEMLEEIRDDMNRDIIAFRNDCIRVYGEEYVKALYPEINGLYVADVREFGVTELFITIRTEYNPIV